LAGRVWFLADSAGRAAVADNLRHVLGRPPGRALVRQVFEHGAYNYWDTFAIPRLSTAELESLVESTGWEHLDAALAKGNGAVMISGHLGSVSLASQLVAVRGHQVVGVVEPIEPPAMFDFMNAPRQSHGIRLLPLGPNAAREMLLTLRQNGVVGLITDRDVLGTGIPVDFFGVPTPFPDGAASLSIRTGAPILPAIVARLPNGKFRGWVEPPLDRAGLTDKAALLTHLTQAVAHRLQYHVAQHPEQWTVFQRRWPDEGVRQSRR
jgi:KDO2-lipid IV(A) lauroyltransferase